MDFNQLFSPHFMAYYAILALIVAIEAATIGVIYKQDEDLRWTIGFLTVFAGALPLVFLNLLDWLTFLVLFIGVGIAGALKVLTHKTINKVMSNSKRSYFDGQ